METEEFKKIFRMLADRYGFKAMRDGWLKESPECIVTLDLQKSAYGKLHYCNIKIFIQGKFDNYYSSYDEELIKKGIGYLLNRSGPEYEVVFDLTAPIADLERAEKLEGCFENFLVQFVEKALTRKGLIELSDNGQFFMVDETKHELARLETVKQDERAGAV